MQASKALCVNPEWLASGNIEARHTLAGFGSLEALADQLGLPDEPCILNQVHGNDVVVLGGGEQGLTADAAVTFQAGVVLAIRTADCLPVLFTDRAGTVVGAAHAGWRGLSSGVLENTVKAMDRDPSDLMAWLGPCIGQDAFEIGPEVRDQFLAHSAAAAAAFRPGRGDRWHADLVALARMRLAAAGVREVSGGGWCTFSDEETLLSFRRGAGTARMATLIWMKAR